MNSCRVEDLEFAPERNIMKKRVALLVLSLTLAACGGSTGTPSITVSGPSSNLLKIGEATNFAADFKDAAGADVAKSFTWTSSAPNIAEVDSSGKVTSKRLGKVTISASSDGVNGSSAVQTTYGLEVVGGTMDGGAFAKPVSLAALFRFRVGSVNPIAANTKFEMGFTGPADWNGGVAVVSKGWAMGTGGVSYWTQPLLDKPVQSGAYQVSTTINGVTYTSGFTVDATQLQARVTNITQQGAATASSVSASWTAAAGATYYQMLVSSASGFLTPTATTTGTNATVSGFTLITNPVTAYDIFVLATNFKFDGGLDTLAPVQFNASYFNKGITF
jgi:hypothetical protein